MTDVWRHPAINAGVGVQNYPAVRLVYPRARDKSQFVERWKVIRDRNKNLPNLDFTAHSIRFPRKVERENTLLTTRSCTQHELRLPSRPSFLRREPPFSVPGTSLSYAPTHIYEQMSKNNAKVQDPLQQQSQLTESILSAPKSPSSAPSSRRILFTTKSLETEKHKFQKIVQQKKLTLRNSGQDKDKTEKPEEHHIKTREETSIYHLDLKSNASSRNYSGKSVKDLTTDDIWMLLDQTRTGNTANHKPWRDNCKCIRCEILKRQYIEKNKHLRVFSQYPLQP